MKNWRLNINNRLLVALLAILILVNLVVFILVGVPLIRGNRNTPPGFTTTPDSIASDPTTLPSPTIDVPATTPTVVPTFSQKSFSNEGLQTDGVIILAMNDGKYSHLFAYHPQYLPLARLRDTPWDEITPAISPDGNRLAYSSRQNGYWDIYILDFSSGEITRLTDTPGYDANPSWSPDGQWIAYESYKDENLDILIQSTVNLTEAPIQLTESAGLDHSPAWSPSGREIAFISDQSGEEEVWLANLDQTENRFINISRNGNGKESHPSWSADGNYLTWGNETDGDSKIYIWWRQNPQDAPTPIASGSWPIWSPTGKVIVSEVSSPNQSAIIGYDFSTRVLSFPSTALPGTLQGMDWKAANLAAVLSKYKFPTNARGPSEPLWNAALELNPLPPSGRFGIVPVAEISAPYPFLHDAVNESFISLRQRVSELTGWDMLANLENAYLPITNPTTPGLTNSWLYTGRSIAVNTAPLYAGWMVINKEDFAGQTYWRLFLKTRYQDGSQGRPITTRVWDLNARYLGNPLTYEQGGQLGTVPAGYWIDFTDLARKYGWERLAALANWRNFYPAARFNHFVLTDGLDWNTAMAELYPPEAVITPTLRPTSTPRYTQEPKNSLPTPSLPVEPPTAATIRPTLTPVPDTP
jgi:TolB protein